MSERETYKQEEPINADAERRALRKKEPYFSEWARLLDVKSGSDIALRDENGRPREPLEVRMFGEVADARGIHTDKHVSVATDTGAIAEKTREMITTGVWGCFVLFIEGQKTNTMIHMTPKTRFGYEKEQLDDSVSRIVSGLQTAGETPANVRVTLVSNTAIDDKARKISKEEQAAVGDALKKVGVITSFRSVDVPMENTAVYFSPDNPDELFVVGEGMRMDEHGELRRTGIMEVKWVSLKDA